uniref:EXPERA domain-containing protein n=1 Tax=Balaenoptera musculus TaxID=9771 RepID=A0A8C0CY76_BALMU
MGPLGAWCGLEWLLGLYFLSYIPFTLLVDLQAVLRNLRQWFLRSSKTPCYRTPPVWFKSFLFWELVFQLPFFPIATYWRGDHGAVSCWTQYQENAQNPYFQQYLKHTSSNTHDQDTGRRPIKPSPSKGTGTNRPIT